jgi:predicted component of type VI protein secretion system
VSISSSRVWLNVGTDHVAEQVADLNYMLHEAHNTLRTLHHELELAEPIEQRIKRLRSRTAGHNSKRSSATV